MTSKESSLAARLGPVLSQREAELRAVLHAGIVGKTDSTGADAGVSDFKDMAAGQSQDVVEDAQGDQAALELEQVRAALQRIADGSYGQCLDCGEPIAERRLTAMPAAAYCIACQAAREQGRPPSALRPT
jgi:RNA polymerase-binding transcription factor DksA